MIFWASVPVTGMFANVWFVTLPFGIATALAAVNPLLTIGLPFIPGPPVWTWVRIIWLFAGKLLRLYTNVAVADVIAPELSRVRSILNVPVPLPLWSAFVIGGTSLAGLKAAVNTTVVGCVFDGDDGLLPHAAATIVTATSRYRFMWASPFEN
jgi:hypothetical protein